MDDEIDAQKEKTQSPITLLDNLMVKNDRPLPSYFLTELENNQWQVTCSVPSLEIEETVISGARHEVRDLVAEKVLDVIGDMGNVKR